MNLFLQVAALCVLFAFSAYGVDTKPAAPQAAKTTEKGKAAVQRIIIEEQKIEGKIRRPQLVLIKADQRPAFPPMIMQSAGKNENVGSFVDPSVIENSANQNAFKFQGTAITNYVP
ncbi:MAG TPA: hypothetical protein VLX68_02595 [Chitinivibrionales bacterium]|nr:hypothetical protein [Chitinivibrionales bacterium]